MVGRLKRGRLLILLYLSDPKDQKFESESARENELAALRWGKKTDRYDR
jgi:hypothetical protein